MSGINIKIGTISTKFHYPYEGIFGKATPPEYIIREVTGNGYINLKSAVANHLMELKAYGGTEQEGRPTPTTPVDIVCNNGALKVKDSELPVGYKRVLGYACDNNVLWQITNFHLRGSDTIRASFSVTAACNVFGCYQGTDADDNYDLYISTTYGAKYLRYGNGTYLSYWSNANLGERFDVVFTPTGTTGMPTDSTWTPMTFESANDLLIAATTLTGTSSKLKGNLYGNFVVDGRLKLIPCERLSDNSLGYYDTYSDTFFAPTGTPISLGYDYTYTSEIYTDGTTETVTDELRNTATAEMLLAIGDYEDEQEILSGNITRKVGVKVFDGTEGWTQRNAGGGNRTFQLSSTYNIIPYLRLDHPALCTHLVYRGMVSGITSVYNGEVGFYLFYSSEYPNAWNFYIKVPQLVADTVEDLQTWLANNRVMVVYVLDTPTTEIVTGQIMNIQAGNNTIEITQASIGKLGLYAKYKATA